MSTARLLIAKLRDEHGFASDRALAAAAGIPQPTLSRFLNGTSASMEVANLQALCQVFGITLSELLGESALGSSVPARELTRLIAQLSDDEQAKLLRIAKALHGSH
jgi:transcriptional regulator with XRE-family HTH domain